MSSSIRYARSGEVNIAYQVTGDGPLDLVLVPGFFSHLDLEWEHPASRRLIERLSAFSRLIMFDKRGTGLSDRAVGLPGEVGRICGRSLPRRHRAHHGGDGPDQKRARRTRRSLAPQTPKSR